MFKVNNKATRTTPMVYFKPCFRVSIVNFEHVIAGWVHKPPEVLVLHKKMKIWIAKTSFILCSKNSKAFLY